jgi:hypothetical protein
MYKTEDFAYFIAQFARRWLELAYLPKEPRKSRGNLRSDSQIDNNV